VEHYVISLIANFLRKLVKKKIITPTQLREALKVLSEDV